MTTPRPGFVSTSDSNVRVATIARTERERIEDANERRLRDMRALGFGQRIGVRL